MIEKIVKDYLESTVWIPVWMEKPSEKPNEYILITKTENAQKDFISSATIELLVHAGSMNKAAILNEKVKKAMDDLVMLDEIVKSKLNTDYPYTDTQTKEYRYQAVYDIVYYD